MSGHGWIQTFTGRRIYPLDPDPSAFHIVDIAHALSNICRFTGHTRHFYSVAQHSVHVHDEVPMEYRLEALLHDAAEAYMNDIATPVKHADGMEFYAMAEDKLRRAIMRWAYTGTTRCYAPLDLSGPVKDADVRMLMTEKRDLLAPMSDGSDWSRKNAEPYPWEIVAWRPNTGKEMFLERARRLLPLTFIEGA